MLSIRMTNGLNFPQNKSKIINWHFQFNLSINLLPQRVTVKIQYYGKISETSPLYAIYFCFLFFEHLHDFCPTGSPTGTICPWRRYVSCGDLSNFVIGKFPFMPKNTHFLGGLGICSHNHLDLEVYCDEALC